MRLMFATCVLGLLYHADAVLAAGVTSEVFVSRAVSYTKGVDVGIPQPYGGINITGCDGPVSVPRTIALGSWFSRIGTFIDLPTNAALVVSFGKPTEFTTIVVYGLANGAGETLDVYARPDDVSAWTYLGQVQESVSVEWFGAVPYTISLADTGLTSVEQVKLVGQDADGCYPGFDLMGVSGLITR